MFTYPIVSARAGVVAQTSSSVTWVGGDTTKTITFSGLADASQCVPFLQVLPDNVSGGTYADEDRLAVACDVWDDGGTVKATLYRNTTTVTDPTYDVRLTLLEFPASKYNVYKYSYTNEPSPAAGYVDKTITSVAVSKTFFVTNCSSDNSDIYTMAGCGHAIGGELTSSTNLRLHRRYKAGTTAPRVYAYVVESLTDNMSVQHLPFNDSLNAVDVTCTPVDISKTMLITDAVLGSVSTGSYPNNYDGRFLCKGSWFPDDTTIRTHSWFGPNRNANVGTAQVITFASGLSAQHAEVWYATNNDVDVSISPVDLSKAVVVDTLPGGLGNSSQSQFTGGAPEQYKAMAGMQFIDSSTIRLSRRTLDGTPDQLTGWQVLQFS